MIRTLILALFLSTGAQAAGTLRFGLDFDIDTLDPARSGSYIERAVANAMCDTLIGLDQKLDLVPQLATGWEWSPDHLALTLHLREGVLFQDGAPMTRMRCAPTSSASARRRTACGKAS